MATIKKGMISEMIEVPVAATISTVATAVISSVLISPVCFTGSREV